MDELWLPELASSEPPDNDQDGLCESHQLASIARDSENLLGNLRASSTVWSSSIGSSSVREPIVVHIGSVKGGMGWVKTSEGMGVVAVTRVFPELFHWATQEALGKNGWVLVFAGLACVTEEPEMWASPGG
ncbi:hypothetical protein EI94DRAFT_1701561 [Lactarius quietus]|nr:hypothetical protein EI94DRAFT_1701561 [Lactarius quietus]